MTSQQIIEALIARDEQTTQQFFFKDCRPLFLSIIRYVFSYEVDYDEFVNELYLHLMEGNACRLKAFEGRSSIYQWLKVVAIRFFVQKRDSLIEDKSQEPLNEIKDTPIDVPSQISAKIDVEYLLNQLKNERYVMAIRRLILEDAEPKDVAEEMGVTIDNLYNIKKRAVAALTQIVLNDGRAQYER
jgi:RNA polymerase sigma factor (sigma-70 family)